MVIATTVLCELSKINRKETYFINKGHDLVQKYRLSENPQNFEIFKISKFHNFLTLQDNLFKQKPLYLQISFLKWCITIHGYAKFQKLSDRPKTS